VTSPEWKSSSADPVIASSQNQEFQKGSNELEKHEDGHVQYDLAGANELQERANAVSVTASGRTPQAAENAALNKAKTEIDNIGKDVTQRVNTANANYDQVTEHGRHQEKAPTRFEIPK